VEYNNNGNGEARLSKVESEISQLVLVQHQQGENIASMMTAIDNQTKQIGSLLQKSGRPFPVRNVLAVISLMIVLTGLALAPLYRFSDRQESFNMRVVEHLIKDANDMGTAKTDLDWLKKLEERANERLHK